MTRLLSTMYQQPFGEESIHYTTDWKLVGTNLLLLVTLWGDLILSLVEEWMVDDQYQFGFLMPFFVIYLVILRWEDRPQKQLPNKLLAQGVAIALLSAVFLLYPFKILQEANPEWRMLLWIQAIITYGLTLGIIYSWAGKSWVKHFCIPFLLLLLAVPWPTRLEQPLIQRLMRLVTAITVEGINFLGIHAVQVGNIIQLKNGLVGVEEACSGVRSFQSTLMSALFLGELFRFSLIPRILFLVIGIGLSLIFNLIRTFSLTLMTYRNGAIYMNEWHDWIGYFIAIIIFFILLAMAWVLQRKKQSTSKSRWDIEEDEATARQKNNTPNWLRVSPIIALFAIYLLHFAVVELWYLRNRPEGEKIKITIDWGRAASVVQIKDIAPTIRAQLRYNEGEKYSWKSRNGTQWTGYLFKWEEGRVSSFVDVHRPEICLPAAGFQLKGQPHVIRWERDQVQLNIIAYEALQGLRPVFVFFSVWDDYPQNNNPLRTDTLHRIESALEGRRLLGRSLLEVSVAKANDINQAKEEFILFLERSVLIPHPD